jgi:hypothetical protein
MGDWIVSILTRSFDKQWITTPKKSFVECPILYSKITEDLEFSKFDSSAPAWPPRQTNILRQDWLLESCGGWVPSPLNSSLKSHPRISSRITRLLFCVLNYTSLQQLSSSTPWYVKIVSGIQWNSSSSKNTPCNKSIDDKPNVDTSLI